MKIAKLLLSSDYPAIGQWAGRRGASVYALDWLGMGRSARVPFTIKATRDDVNGRVAEAESFFVDSLEEWRAAHGHERMTLVGHSLGGYLSVAYAEKYPERVSRLILLSPAGVPHDPNGTTLPSRELAESQDETRQGSGQGAAMVASQGGEAAEAMKGKVKEMKKDQEVQKRQESTSRKLFTHLWEQGWSPFQVVRSTLFYAPLLVGKVRLGLTSFHGSEC
jgi:cardiolipin-specific phospholipase